MLYLEKSCEVILFRSLSIIHTTSIGPPITEKQSFKKLKSLFFLALFISKIKIVDIFNFLSVRYFSKGFFFLKTLHIRVNYCWNYGPWNLLFRFFRCRLGHLNNRQIKIQHVFSRTLENTFFWRLTSKQVFGESFKFFDPPTTKWRSFNFFVKLNGNHILMANF